MELNAKNPFLCDVENLAMFNTKDGEPPKTLQLVESEIEGIEGFEVGSFYSSGGHSDGAVSDLGHASSSRSSKSASNYSSSDSEIKETNFSFDTNDCFQQDLNRKRELGKTEVARTSPTVESSVASGESLIALELCNKTYFEDLSRERNVKITAKTSVPPGSSAKKSKSTSPSSDIFYCQIEGCNLDLSSAKDYHRKHKVCEYHSKCPRVVIKGHERRFCQQCSRFHSISEFDEKKRSCRRRLSDHNARRRKPKPEVIQFNSMRMASSLYEGRNQLNFGFDQIPVIHTQPGTWDSTKDDHLMLAKSGLITSITAGTLGLHCQSPLTKVSPVSSDFLSSEGAPPEAYHRGLPASVAPTNLGTTQDVGALSLLSTGSWGSCDPIDHHTIQPNNPLQAVHGDPSVSLDFWMSEQPLGSGPGSHTSSFQLFKGPNESSFYLY